MHPVSVQKEQFTLINQTTCMVLSTIQALQLWWAWMLNFTHTITIRETF